MIRHSTKGTDGLAVPLVAGLVALLLLPATASGQDVGEEDVPGEESAATAGEAADAEEETALDALRRRRGLGPGLRGFWDLRYRARVPEHGSTDRDHDVHETLLLRARGNEHVAFRFLGRLDVDVDGRHRNELFGSLEDTYDDNVHGYLYEAYLDVERYRAMRRMRLGRQTLRGHLPIRFDGARLDLRRGRVRGTVYGGVPAHLSESNPRGDWLAGGALTYSLPRFKLRADYVHVTDRRAPSDRRRDDVVQLALTWLPVSGLKLYGLASTNDGEAHRWLGRVFWRDAAHDLAMSFGAEARTGSWRDLSIEFSPLSEVIGRLEDYAQLTATLTKGFGEHLSIDLGARARELIDDADEGPFNREFQHYFTNVVIRELPWDGLETTGTFGSYVRGDDQLLDLGGELAQEAGDVILRLGSAYYIFRVSTLTLDEREDVRVAYARADWRPTYGPKGARWHRPFRFRASYQAEWGDVGLIHVVDLGIRFIF